jgi:hypothetical protein
MTLRPSDHEPIRFLEEFVCEAIPGPSVPRAREAGSGKNSEEMQRPQPGDEESKAGDLRPEPPADSVGEGQGT